MQCAWESSAPGAGCQRLREEVARRTLPLCSRMSTETMLCVWVSSSAARSLPAPPREGSKAHATA